MTAYELSLTLGSAVLVVGMILMLLRTIWAELRSSLWILNRTRICLEEIESRLARLDAILDQFEGDTRSRKVSE